MKACICFYGLAQRSLKYTIKSINECIFATLQKENVKHDIYLHTHDTKYAFTTRIARSQEDNIPLDINDFKLLNPDVYTIDSEKDFNNSYDWEKIEQHGDPYLNETAFRHTIRELNSVKQVTNLWKNKKNDYDFFVYLRPDLTFSEKIPIEHIVENLNHKKVIFTCPFGKSGGLNDWLAVGNREGILPWAERIDEIFNYCTRKLTKEERIRRADKISRGVKWKMPLHAERLVKFVVEKNGMTHFDLPMRCTRTRAHGRCA